MHYKNNYINIENKWKVFRKYKTLDEHTTINFNYQTLNHVSDMTQYAVARDTVVAWMVTGDV
jgi:hypothetical protein